VSIGEAAAAVSYRGPIGAGLYQINVTVPGDLAAGGYPVTTTASGAGSPSTSAAMLRIAAR
jgi:uncharacterized protein (TIGR03437 family)